MGFFYAVIFMSVSKIIRHFEGIAKIPVEVSAVHEQIKLRRPFEIIEIIGVDVPPTFVHGLIYKYKIPPIEGSMLTDKDKTIIPYSTQAHAYMQRLVACKELLHVLDPDPVLTSNMKQVWVLAEHMSNGKAIANPSAVTIDVLLTVLRNIKQLRYYSLTATENFA